MSPLLPRIGGVQAVVTPYMLLGKFVSITYQTGSLACAAPVVSPGGALTKNSISYLAGMLPESIGRSMKTDVPVVVDVSVPTTVVGEVPVYVDVVLGRVVVLSTVEPIEEGLFSM